MVQQISTNLNEFDSSNAAVLIEGVAGGGKSTLIAEKTRTYSSTGACLLLSFSRTGAEVLHDYTRKLGLGFSDNLWIQTIDSLAVNALKKLGDDRYILDRQFVAREILPHLVQQACETMFDIDFYAPQLSEQDMLMLLDDMEFFRVSLAFEAVEDEECEWICGDRLNYDWRLVRRVFALYEECRMSWRPANIRQSQEYAAKNVKYLSAQEKEQATARATEGFRTISEAVFDLLNTPQVELKKVLPVARYVLIDEFHDINPLQLRLIEWFTHEAEVVIAVGDRNQNIFVWRGANTNYVFEKFVNSFNAKVINQAVTFRFGQELADLASSIINRPIISQAKHNTIIAELDLKTALLERNKSSKKTALIVQNYEQLIRVAFACWRHTRGECAIAYGLTSTFGVQVLNLLFCLIKGQLIGSDENALLDLKAFLSRPFCLLGLAAKAEIIKSFNAQAWQTYTRIHVQTQTGELQAYSYPMQQALSNWLSKAGVIEKFLLADLLEAFADQANLFRGIELNKTQSQFDSIAWQELIHILRSEKAKLLDWPRLYNLLHKSRNKRYGLQLLTVAQAKGKEFDHVMLWGTNRQGFIAGRYGIDSERNEFYVGITRAIKKLTLLRE